ncbi:MAG TPA: hypothetical protein VG370_20500 [Chloroflexota bacterium]|nr:hypothetical protein [Chloroflexota bacterium]
MFAGGFLFQPLLVAQGEERREGRARLDPDDTVVFDQQVLEERPGEPVALRLVRDPPGRAHAPDHRRARLQVVGRLGGRPERAQALLERRALAQVALARVVAPLVELLDPLEPRLERAALLVAVAGRLAHRAHRREQPLLVVLGQPEGAEVRADLLLVDGQVRQAVGARAGVLEPGAAEEPRPPGVRGLDPDRRTAQTARREPAQRVGPRPRLHLDGAPAVLLAHRLHPLPERLVEAFEGRVPARRPADLDRPLRPGAVAELLVDRQVAPVEAVGQDLGDRVLLEGVLPAVAGRAVAGRVQRPGDAAVARALGRETEREPEPGEVARLAPPIDHAPALALDPVQDAERPAVLGRHAIVPGDHAERREAVVEALCLALALALPGLLAEVVRVPLGQRAEHDQEEPPLRRRVVDLLGHRDERHVRAPEAVEAREQDEQVAREPVELVDDDRVDLAGVGRVEHRLEARAPAEVFVPGAAALLDVLDDDLPASLGAVGADRAELRVEAVALQLLLARDAHVHSRPHPAGLAVRADHRDRRGRQRADDLTGHRRPRRWAVCSRGAPGSGLARTGAPPGPGAGGEADDGQAPDRERRPVRLDRRTERHRPASLARGRRPPLHTR